MFSEKTKTESAKFRRSTTCVLRTSPNRKSDADQTRARLPTHSYYGQLKTAPNGVDWPWRNIAPRMENDAPRALVTIQLLRRFKLRMEYVVDFWKLDVYANWPVIQRGSEVIACAKQLCNNDQSVLNSPNSILSTPPPIHQTSSGRARTTNGFPTAVFAKRWVIDVVGAFVVT